MFIYRHDDVAPYQKQLLHVRRFLTCAEEDRTDEEVVKYLGTSISALYSVPTAIYCFLRAQEEIPGIKVCFYFFVRKKIMACYKIFFYRLIIYLDEQYNMR